MGDEFGRSLTLWNWQLSTKGYVFRHKSRKGCHRGSLYLHRIIAEHYFGPIPPGKEVDHLDGNPFNCRPDNLRFATKTENQFNRPAPKNNTSGFKGVSRLIVNEGRNSYWVAAVRSKGKRLFFRYFPGTEQGKSDAGAAVLKAYKDLGIVCPRK